MEVGGALHGHAAGFAVHAVVLAMVVIGSKGDPVRRHRPTSTTTSPAHFIKSLRGSDPDAASHLLDGADAGNWPLCFIARWLVIAGASEDVGMADPTAPPMAIAPAD